MLTLLQLIIGIYLLVCAVRGKGKVLENEYLKIPRERYVKIMRILSAICGAVLCATSALELAGILLPGTVLAWVFWALGIASILPLLVFSIKATDREAAKAGKPGPEAGQKAPAHDPLRAAFVFDDEEEEEGTDSADAASNGGKQA